MQHIHIGNKHHVYPALVIGFTIHGLAVARALSRQGVDVHCLSDQGSSIAPTTYTRYAKVHFRRGLNTGPLPEYLREVAQQIGSDKKIVLFPTSDRIAKAIALHWDELSDRFILSWSHCRDLVLELQRKDSLAAHCERAQVRYPRSVIVRNAAECGLAEALRFPVAIKPAQPLSSFKAIRGADMTAVHRCVAQYPQDLPFVVQEWVSGPEPSLYSCTTYLDRGKPVYLAASRKIAAHPPGVGQGTVFQTIDEPMACTIAEQFLKRLDLSGPAAVEFKRDAAGELWLIEPNVGRTEYCVDLMVQSGFNLPYLEYLHATGGPWQTAIPTRTYEAAWFDTDKDPACLRRNLHALRGEKSLRRAIFPFLGHGDWRPFAAALAQQLRRPADAVLRRLQGQQRGRAA